MANLLRLAQQVSDGDFHSDGTRTTSKAEIVRLAQICCAADFHDSGSIRDRTECENPVQQLKWFACVSDTQNTDEESSERNDTLKAAGFFLWTLPMV